MRTIAADLLLNLSSHARPRTSQTTLEAPTPSSAPIRPASTASSLALPALLSIPARSRRSVGILRLAKLGVHRLFVLVHEAHGSLGELLRQTLHLGRLHPVEDDDVVDRVERGRNVVCVDHAGHDRENGRAGQGEGSGKVGKRQGGVEGGVGEDVRSQRLFLDFSTISTWST